MAQGPKKNFVFLLCLLICSLTSFNFVLADQKISNHDYINQEYQNWNNKVLESQFAINRSKSIIETSYDAIRQFDGHNITAGWIENVANIIAQNKDYRAFILEAADEFPDNRLIFAMSLLSYPQDSIQYQPAIRALTDGLKYVEKFDYNYRYLSNAFEDSARGRQSTGSISHENISYIVPEAYASKKGPPSVAEQMLTAAAIKILNMTEHPAIRDNYQNILSSRPIETCLADAQRNSAQCKAASNDKNDLSFCMARHAIKETTECFSWILP